MAQNQTTEPVPSHRPDPGNCGLRRLPVYFVLDFSGSPRPGFTEAAAGQVWEHILQLESLAVKEPRDFQRTPVFYTIIVFRAAALQLHPLAPPGRYGLEALRLNEIGLQGPQGLAAALGALESSIEHELKMPGADNGDDLPLVFLFTDTLPGEKLKAPAAAKLFICGVEAPPKVPIFTGTTPKFLPLANREEIWGHIEAARTALKAGRQQMIDYPTVY